MEGIVHLRRMDLWQVTSCCDENRDLVGMGGMRQKQAFLTDSPDSGMMYPHKVGLASHRGNGNFGENSILLRGRPDDKN